jgi:hypothetical protein
VGTGEVEQLCFTPYGGTTTGRGVPPLPALQLVHLLTNLSYTHLRWVRRWIRLVQDSWTSWRAGRGGRG